VTKKRPTAPVVYCLFDLLWSEGRVVTSIRSLRTSSKTLAQVRIFRWAIGTDTAIPGGVSALATPGIMWIDIDKNPCGHIQRAPIQSCQE
jgi:hypothetical protein